ncbi:hypothetical protein N8J89_18090 [Crossiella sp. CA-258035]|uniref:hypothetical protein n=1 Tax=Crossiella sp. CA-258035 TaxID=2981138 RepID=UPI0024BCE3DF|nr:hypothetical protein [Crossiella sp. CA-258035]WHT22904.1 hypothetical protein N8J89_18090 [Crossiella sp. CA-258035]
MSRRTGALVLSVAATAVALTAGPAQATPADPGLTHASVTGAARLDYITREDDVRFIVDAHALRKPGMRDPVRSWGTARITHYFAANKVQLWATGPVDCVTAGGRSATVSIIVTDTAPEIADWRGKRMGFSLHSGGPGEAARVGTTGPVDADKLPKCVAPAPELAVLTGGYRVRDR